VLLHRDRAGDVRHIDHEERADFAAHVAEFREIDHPRISARPGQNQLRLVLARQLGDLIVIDPLCVARHAVMDDLEVFAREIEPHAVRQVAAVS
jgi:hypothetical protein